VEDKGAAALGVEKGAGQVGDESADDRRSPKDPGEDFAEDHRLIEALGYLGKEAGRGKEKPQGKKEDRDFM
jgi:hypothetical protein